MRGRRSYAAQDAALKALGKEESRRLLEDALAWHIRHEAAFAEFDPAITPYLRGEINGLCIALRLLGGYEGIAFNVEWARQVAPSSFNWLAFLGYSPASGEAAEPEAPEPGECPRPRPGTRMLDLPPSSADPMQQAEQSIGRLKRELSEEASSMLALALAQRFKTAIATAQWELGLDAFCQLLGFDPEHEHGREKFRSFASLAEALNRFDERSVATLLEWQAARERAATLLRQEES